MPDVISHVLPVLLFCHIDHHLNHHFHGDMMIHSDHLDTDRSQPSSSTDPPRYRRRLQDEHEISSPPRSYNHKPDVPHSPPADLCAALGLELYTALHVAYIIAVDDEISSSFDDYEISRRYEAGITFLPVISRYSRFIEDDAEIAHHRVEHNETDREEFPTHWVIAEISASPPRTPLSKSEGVDAARPVRQEGGSVVQGACPYLFCWVIMFFPRES